jgi:membrane protein DedA with SNARE-associated domain
MPPPADLPSYLHGIAPILDRWSYLAVAAIIGVESFGFPAPGQTIMVVAAIYSSSGRLDVWLVGIIAFLAAVIGDNIGYWIGLRGGRKAVHRFGKYIFITPERLERAEKFFLKRGNGIVVVARFIDGLRQLNGVIAGLTSMPWRTFLLYNAIGAALWVGWWVTIAYFLGNHVFDLIGKLHHFGWVAIVAVVLAIATYVFFHMRHIRRRRARSAGQDASSDAKLEESQA